MRSTSRYALALVVFGATSTIAQKADHEPLILSSVPRGWVHVPRDATDTALGVYFDSVSGAYVSYTLPGSSQGEAWEGVPLGPRDRRWTATVGRSRADVTFFADAREALTRQMAKVFGVPEAEVPQLVGTVMYPASSTLMSVSFNDGVSGQFSAAVCNDLQEGRVKELLLPAQGERSRVTQVSRADGRIKGVANLLRSGASLPDVLRIMGEPRLTERVACDGIAITYYGTKEAWTWTSARLSFDSKGELVSMEYR